MRQSSINSNDVSLGAALLRRRCRQQVGETITIADSKDGTTRHVTGSIALEFIRRSRA
jgi:hypothetical protein